MRYTFPCSTPLGPVLLASDGEALTGLWFQGQKHLPRGLDRAGEEKKKTLPVFDQVRRWLDVYFSGREPDFLPPLRPGGTAFQAEVWALLRGIPYGRTVTYGELARELAARRGHSRPSARAVGGAVGRNPISILIPCHRVVGADGGLTGYAGGLDKKISLLRLEGGGRDGALTPAR